MSANKEAVALALESAQHAIDALQIRVEQAYPDDGTDQPSPVEQAFSAAVFALRAIVCALENVAADRAGS